MALVRAIHTSRNPLFDRALQWISDTTAWLSFGGVFVLLFYAYRTRLGIGCGANGDSHKKTYLSEAVILLLSLLLATVFVQVFKSLLHRPRPYEVYSFIKKLSDAGGGSFPSGHTADAFTVAAFLMLGDYRWLLVLFVLGWAFAVGYSRITLGVHYGSDVLGAVLLGCLSAWVVRTLAGRSQLLYEKDYQR